ncbi:MAG: hypothetical protein WC373_00890 [Smithella sp.]|jgi:post-segregation antitoxin (ccd killing protein)
MGNPILEKYGITSTLEKPKKKINPIFEKYGITPVGLIQEEQDIDTDIKLSGDLTPGTVDYRRMDEPIPEAEKKMQAGDEMIWNKAEELYGTPVRKSIEGWKMIVDKIPDPESKSAVMNTIIGLPKTALDIGTTYAALHADPIFITSVGVPVMIKALKNTNLWRTMTIKERALATSANNPADLNTLIKRSYISKLKTNPAFYQEELMKRGGGIEKTPIQESIAKPKINPIFTKYGIKPTEPIATPLVEPPQTPLKSIIPPQKVSTPQELVETQRETIVQQYERLRKVALENGLPEPQAVAWAKENLKAMPQEAPKAVEKPVQEEFTAGGVESFGKGAKGEQDIFDQIQPETPQISTIDESGIKTPEITETQADASAGALAKEPEVIDEESYLARKGASKFGFGEPALSKNIPENIKKELVNRQLKKDIELTDKRELLRKEYSEKIKSGEIRPPTRMERLISTANGNPDNQAVQAARRILEKNGIDWHEGTSKSSKSAAPEADADLAARIKEDQEREKYWTERDKMIEQEFKGQKREAMTTRIDNIIKQHGKIRLTKDEQMLGEIKELPLWKRRKYFTAKSTAKTIDQIAETEGIHSNDIRDMISQQKTQAENKRQFERLGYVSNELPEDVSSSLQGEMTYADKLMRDSSFAGEEKHPFRISMTNQDDEIRGMLKNKEIPKQESLPDKGEYPAVRTDDGSIFFGHSGDIGSHFMMIKNQKIPIKRLESGGWLIDGIYEATPRSDTMRLKARAEQIEVSDEMGGKMNVYDVSKDLVESKNREEIQDKLQKIFGTYEDIEKMYNGDIPLTKLGELANDYMADIEYAANNRDIDEVKKLLHNVNEGIGIEDEIPAEQPDQKPYYTPREERTVFNQQPEKAQGVEEKKEPFNVKLPPNIPPEVAQAIREYPTPLEKKINIFDYFKTPENVLKKIGMGNEMKFLRQGYDRYIQELPGNMNIINQWAKRVGKESNPRIFQYLDGEPVELNQTELEVAKEIEEWLVEWADRLGLPEESRITDYITHLFEDQIIKKEFDEDIAKIISGQVAGSVYDPFLMTREGMPGYKQDTWAALEAYVKRATRKVNMDPALDAISKVAETLEKSQWDYIKKYIDKVNMRPSDLDNLLDNGIKQILGYRLGQRPVATITRFLRRMTYRAKLGLNVSSSLRNLSQGINTYAVLGEKYTVVGYSKLFSPENYDELVREGVLDAGFIEDRRISATEKAIDKIDSGLFYLFNTVEKINRGAAYFGGKAKMLAQDKTEQEAIEYGKEVVRKTQFLFSSIDQPVALGSDLAKTLMQLQNYTVKQIEFLGGMAKDKNFIGLTRYIVAGLVFVYTIGKIFGMRPKELIPMFRFGAPPALELPWEAGKAALNIPDKYGHLKDTGEKISSVARAALGTLPASAQGKKTISGLSAYGRGYTETPTGRVKYPIEGSMGNLLRAGLFGPFSVSEAREYYSKKRQPLGDIQSRNFKRATDPAAFYENIMKYRDYKRKTKERKEAMRKK